MPETPKKPPPKDKTVPKPRQPGSQVSPNPNHRARGGKSLADSTAGKLYRVRDKDHGDGDFAVWGENLSYNDACKLKEQVVGARKSKTARVEEMPEPEPELPFADPATEIGGGAGSAIVAAPVITGTGTIEGIPVVTSVVLNPSAIGNPDETPIVAGLPAGLVEMMVESGQVQVVTSDSFNKPSADPELEAIRQKAVAAAAPAAKAAQAKHDHKKIVMKDPPKPPPSPLSDELADLPDGPEELPDEVLEAGDVHEITASVGGELGDDDAARAKAQADRDFGDSESAGKAAYQKRVALDRHPDTWPSWSELGPFELAAWRYYGVNGGTQPELTRTMRKPTASMLTPEPDPDAESQP